MARITMGSKRRKRHKRWLKLAKGYYGTRHSKYKIARMSVMKALQHAYRERRRKKRVFRALWILRLNAALRAHGISYSRFIAALRKKNVELNRKSLSELAIRDPESFKNLVDMVKE